jgi:hypothetical protein
MKLCSLAIALVVSAPIAATAQDVTGDWVVTVDSPQGATSIDLTMKQAGEDLTGTITSPMGAVEFKGKIAKNAINVAYNLDLQGNAIAIRMTGTVAGDDITGNLNVGGLGDVPWTAKRKAAGAAPAARPPAASSSALSGAGAAAVPGSNDITGKWDVTFNMAGNPMPASATFTQAGDKVTGTLSSQAGETALTGTMSGQAVKLDFTLQTPQGDLQITMTGDVGADGITGKANLAGIGEADWSAKRAK